MISIRSMAAGLSLCGLFVTSLPGAVEPDEKILDALESEVYPERVRAQEQLKSWATDRGEVGRRWLMTQVDSSESPEISSRSYEVLKDLVLDELRRERPGFVGITMAEEPLGNDQDAGFGVRISSVQPGSPADQGGLQPGDLIVELNGNPWAVEGAPDRFALEVAAMGPGTEIQLTVRRGGETHEIELELAARPWSIPEYGEAMFGRFGLEGRARKTEAEAEEEVFNKWLKEHFGRADQPATRD